MTTKLSLIGCALLTVAAAGFLGEPDLEAHYDVAQEPTPLPLRPLEGATEAKMCSFDQVSFGDYCSRYITPTSLVNQCGGRTRLDEMIEAAAAEFCVDPRALAVTVYKESNCNPSMTGAVGEVGLVQVYPKYWLRELCNKFGICSRRDLRDPFQNLRAGAYILSKMQDRAERRGEGVHGAFRRYNGAGPMARRYAKAQMSTFRDKFSDAPRVRGACYY